ncbi:hypothetical protein E4T47_01134 [Aureobasidium subglaciale]|nr:hypothetical protein E4T43_06263 [Aureobasidium subglaciale]KAI5275994.1 hypothetical protein E4T47_01134 [Aureobasidium subglaciale]
MTPQFGLPTEGGHLTATCAIAIVLALTYVLAHIVYNLYFHPLASFPGPLLARSSLEAGSTVEFTTNTRYTVKAL